MKRYIFTLTLLGIFSLHSSTFASCLYQEIDPVCSIAGKTYTNTCQGWSDTSSWYIPKAYDGVCEETPELTDAQKETVFNFMNEFFTRHDMKGSLYGDVSTASDDSMTLNLKGQKFLLEKLFPVIGKFIVEEREKEDPNINKIAVLNYVASIIGYDYYLTK